MCKSYGDALSGVSLPPISIADQSPVTLQTPLERDDFTYLFSYLGFPFIGVSKLPLHVPRHRHTSSAIAAAKLRFIDASAVTNAAAAGVSCLSSCHQPDEHSQRRSMRITVRVATWYCAYLNGYIGCPGSGNSKQVSCIRYLIAGGARGCLTQRHVEQLVTIKANLA
jgi:hypothetical protein